MFAATLDNPSALGTPAVAKKRPPKKPDPVPPVSGFFQLKMPVDYWHPLQDSKPATGRDMNVSAMIALEMYFRALGIPFEENFSGVVNELVGRLTKSHK